MFGLFDLNFEMNEYYYLLECFNCYNKILNLWKFIKTVCPKYFPYQKPV